MDYELIKQEIECQACASNRLESVLDLGHQPLCNEFSPSNVAKIPQMFYPLCLYYCLECSLVQLGHVIPTSDTFGGQYTYLTGSSKSLVEYYDLLARTIFDQLCLNEGDVVVDIGSNDGTFLKSFQSLGLTVLGVEGAIQPAQAALEKGVPTIVDFFGPGISRKIEDSLPEGSKVRLIVAMNVLAHTDNINDFLSEVVGLMDEDTILISQSHWLMELMRKFEFDTIYHEHLRYYTLSSLINLFKRHGLNISDVEIKDFYGGSILTYATKSIGHSSSKVLEVLDNERQIDVRNAFKEMKKVLLDNKISLLSLLVNLKASGKRVVGIGAPMKASTLLNFYGVTSDLVEYLAEVNELKVGTYVPGVHIPVVHEDQVFENQPDYAMILSWNMSEAIISNFRTLGYKGKFIIPVPRIEVLE